MFETIASALRLKCELLAGDGPDAQRSLYGDAAKWIFAIALLLSGINSMVSNTLGGQAAWEGFTGNKVAFWKVVLVTRTVVIVPPLVLAITVGNQDVTFTIINDWISIYMSLAMPMASIPVLDIAASKLYMKDFALRPVRIAISVLLVLTLIGINFYLIAEFLFDPITFGSEGDFPTASTFYAGVGAVWLAYAYVLWRLAFPGLCDLWAWATVFVSPKAVDVLITSSPDP